ncbi:thioredoxin family protein [Schlesneria sp. T3-172]|uniref:thioredoxin family protein n=1 Tax=Schlesneria sphaerica TaxID=3373610 RepID=UPI0037C7EFFB
MRQIVRSMLSLSFLITPISIGLIGCGSVAEPNRQSQSPAAPAAPATAVTAQSVAEAESKESTTTVAVETPRQQALSSESTSSELAETPVEAAAPAKPKRRPIYDETADAKELIAKAIRRAQRDDKQVIIEWGGNWCGWCYLLHDCFTKVPEVAKIVNEEYELVLVDSNSNEKLMKEYTGDHSVQGFPHLTIVDQEGKVLTNQDTEPLEQGRGHDPALVTAFLSKWAVPKVDAEQLLSSKLELAKSSDKRVLFRVADPYCGWCKVLSQFVQDHESLLAKDFVDVKIDTLRMSDGVKVSEAHRPPNANGHPWFIIMGPAGEVLATSVSDKGNIGYPGATEEIAHFMKMLRDTRKSLTDEDLASLEVDLNDFRIRREKKLAEQSSN